MEKVFSEFANEADRTLSIGINFREESDLERSANKVLGQIAKFKIGPRLLLLLVVFSFPREKREKLWNEVQNAVSLNK